MLDSMIAMQGYLSQIDFLTGRSPEPVGTQHPSIVPYGSFPTADGYVIVACLTERFWHNFARCLGHPELIDDPRFAIYQQRLAHRSQLEPIINARMTSDTSTYWLARLAEYDVPSAPILSIGEALEQDHVAARQLIETVQHPVVGDMRMVRSPIRFDGEGPAPCVAPSLLGEGTVSILRDELNVPESEIRCLTARGIIKTCAN